MYKLINWFTRLFRTREEQAGIDKFKQRFGVDTEQEMGQLLVDRVQKAFENKNLIL